MQWNSRRTFCAQAALEALSLACAGDPGPGGEKFGHPAGQFCRVSFLFRLMHTSGQLAARRAALVALTWPACWTPALVAKHLGVPFLGTRQPVGLEVVPASHGAHSGKHKNPPTPGAQGGHRRATRWYPTPGWGPVSPCFCSGAVGDYDRGDPWDPSPRLATQRGSPASGWGSLVPLRFLTSRPATGPPLAARRCTFLTRSEK